MRGFFPGGVFLEPVNVLCLLYKLQRRIQTPCQTHQINLFAKIINDCKGEFETPSNIYVRAFRASYYRLQGRMRKLAKNLRWIFLRKQLITAKANPKPFQISEFELCEQVVTGYRVECKVLPNIWDGAFCGNS